MLNKVLIFDGTGRPAAATTALSLVIGNGLGLGITRVRQGDHHILLGDQVFGCQVFLRSNNLRQPVITIFFPHGGQLFTDNLHQPFRLSEDDEQLRNSPDNLFVFSQQALLLEARQAIQAHLQDGMGLVG